MLDFRGKPEDDYKELISDVLPVLDDYRSRREMTGRYYGSTEEMEQVWSDVLNELQVDFDAEMYEENRLQTNLAIFEDVYKHEITKVEAEVKQLQDKDLMPLRMSTQERVQGVLARVGQTPRSARGTMFQTKEDSWRRHFTRSSDGEIINSRHI